MSVGLINRIKNERASRRAQSLPAARANIGPSWYRDLWLEVGLHSLTPLPDSVFIGVNAVEVHGEGPITRVERSESGNGDPAWDDEVVQAAKGAV